MDYIGQLIRAGRIVGSKVGRTWYVDEESLSQYLGKEFQVMKSMPVVTEELPILPEAPSPIVVKHLEEIKKEDKKDEYMIPIKSSPSFNASPGLRYISDEQSSFKTVPQQTALSKQKNYYPPTPVQVRNSPPIEQKSTQKYGLSLVLLSVLGLIVGIIALGSSYFLQYQISVNGAESQASVVLIQGK
jgi:hypothetical protein